MTKISSPHLYRLVKSLEKVEKRYFKLWRDPHGEDNKYMLLYESILEQEEFDDEALQKRIYGEEELTSKKFPELKAYLYKLVLRSIQLFEEDKSIEYRLKGYLMNIRVLFRRSLFKACHEQINKAQKIAEHFEEFTSMLEVLRWQKELAYTRTDITYLNRELDKIWEEEKRYLEMQREVIELRNLFFKLLIELRKDASRKKGQLTHIRQLASHKLLQKNTPLHSHKAEVIRLRFISLYHFSLSEFREFNKKSRELLKLMESKRWFLKDDLSEYISAINNHLISCGQLEQYEEVRKYLDKLKALRPITHDDRLKIHRQYYMNAFRVYINTGEFGEGLLELLEHQKELENFERAAFEKSTFYFQYFYIYFGAGDFDQALFYLNEWLSRPKNVERRDLHALAKVLHLIVLYEKGEMVLDHITRVTERYLKRKGRMYRFEEKIFGFFIKVSRLKEEPFSVETEGSSPLLTEKQAETRLKKVVEEELLKLKQHLEKVKVPRAEKRTMRLFDFQAWVESQIQKKTFGEIVRMNYRKRKSATSSNDT